MSSNDTPIDDTNPQVPADAKVIDWVQATRERLAAEESGQTRSPSMGYVTEDEGVPAEQVFDVVLIDEETGGPGITLAFKGYMVATSVFVGFADKDGIISAMVPINRVLYVKSKDQ